jgi:uncharacterized membrane protein YcaP (DUF421 family)
MDSVLRAVIVYFLLLGILRLSGKRSLAENSTFDFVLLLLISETAQQWLLGEDFSFTNAVILIVTLAGLNIVFSLLKQRFRTVAKLVDGVPMLLVENGNPLKEPMKRARIEVSDVLSAARELQGLERMDQIKYAVLETSGVITVIPK